MENKKYCSRNIKRGSGHGSRFFSTGTLFVGVRNERAQCPQKIPLVAQRVTSNSFTSASDLHERPGCGV